MANDAFSNEQSLVVSVAHGHRFNWKLGEKEIEPGLNCLRCCKPLWQICKERREDVEKKRNIAKCKGKPDECVT